MFVRVHCSCMQFPLHEYKLETVIFSTDFFRAERSSLLLRQDDTYCSSKSCFHIRFSEFKTLWHLKVFKFLRKHAIFLFAVFYVWVGYGSRLARQHWPNPFFFLSSRSSNKGMHSHVYVLCVDSSTF